MGKCLGYCFCVHAMITKKRNQNVATYWCYKQIELLLLAQLKQAHFFKIGIL